MSNSYTGRSVIHKGQIRISFSVLGMFLSAILVAACASAPPVENVVKERAQARWDALVSGDYDTAYSFYSPGYRSSTSRVDFEIAIRLRRIRWVTAEVTESRCEADACTVLTLAGYHVARPVPGMSDWESTKKIDERWVRTQGEWWYVPAE